MDFPYQWHADGWRPILRLITDLLKCECACEAGVSDLVLESQLLSDHVTAHSQKPRTNSPALSLFNPFTERDGVKIKSKHEISTQVEGMEGAG